MHKTLILISIITLSSCTQSMGNLSVVSTRELDMGAYYKRVGTQVSGHDTIHIISFFPSRTEPLNIEDAINDALGKYNADLMTNCEITTSFFWIPYIYGQSKLTISGDIWKESGYDIGLINTNKNQLLFAFVDGELRPIESIEIN